jgi:hypothetical protein
MVLGSFELRPGQGNVSLDALTFVKKSLEHRRWMGDQETCWAEVL